MNTKKKPLGNPVTLIIGIVKPAAVLMATESRTSFIAGQGDFRDDTHKIEIINFKDTPVLFARSGSEDIGSGVMEILSESAKNTPIVDFLHRGRNSPRGIGKV